MFDEIVVFASPLLKELAILWVLLLVIVPVWILLVFRFPKIAHVRCADLHVESLPRGTRDALESFDRHLTEIGFIHAGDFVSAPYGTSCILVSSLYHHASQQDRAVATALIAKNLGWRYLQQKLLLFNSRIGEDCYVETCDHAANPHLARPTRTSAHYPGMQPGELYQKHVELIGELTGGERWPLPGSEQFDKELADEIDENSRMLERDGVFVLTANERKYRYSLKSAALESWKLLPPTSWIRRWMS